MSPPKSPDPYESFLRSPSKNQWQRIGIQRRAGVAVPLFSIYSAQSVGLGELPDLKLLVDWCQTTGMSIIQLLPMNDVGFDFRPYDAQSTFALEPTYLSLEKITGVDLGPWKGEIKRLRESFPPGGRCVRYGVKRAKLDLLWKMFSGISTKSMPEFERYIEKNKFWLPDYALFKAIKQEKNQSHWEAWDEALRRKDPQAVQEFARAYAERIRFYEWLQWQLYEQFREAKRYAEAKGVLLMGDLPFLVSRDSAEVWSHQDYFKLDRTAGAPPDAYYALGQRWGMPPYRWEKIAEKSYDYLIEKLRYAENFYDLFRIDHVIGVFRIWTIPLTEPLESGGQKGIFDPLDKGRWEEHGRRLLSVVIENTTMLPCGEDLGTVPECSYRVLEDFAIPGMDVQRWMRYWGKSDDFKKPEDYRRNSIAVISTHDSTSLHAWWAFESGTIDEEHLRRRCAAWRVPFESIRGQLFDPKTSSHGRLRWRSDVTDEQTLLQVLKRSEKEVGELLDWYRASYTEREKFCKYVGMEGPPAPEATPELVRKALEKINESISIFSIQLLTDWLSLAPSFQEDPWEFRINFPGTISEKNWTIVMPYSLEAMKQLAINEEIDKINSRAGRV